MYGVKSSCFDMIKNGYKEHILSYYITSYDKKKRPGMLVDYESKGCSLLSLDELSNIVWEKKFLIHQPILNSI